MSRTRKSTEALSGGHGEPGSRELDPESDPPRRKRSTRSMRQQVRWPGLLLGAGLILVTSWSLRQVQAQGADAAVARGKQVYAASKCSICHALGGKGGNVGPALDDVGKRWTADKLAAFLRDPSSVNQDSGMPATHG